MRPVAGERPAGARLGLGDLALVVWKDQVLAATVEVERLSEIFHGHRRTLDVPARTSGTPRAVPRRLARFRALPEREITRVALALVDLDAGAGEELVEVLAGEPAVGREATDLEIDVAVDRVGVTGRHQPSDELDHLRHVLRRLRVDVGGQDPERGHVGALGGDEALGELARGDALLVRALDDPVVDVGIVLDERDPITLEREVAANHVEGHRASRVADVRVVVYGHPAHVHSHLRGGQRDEFLLRPRHRVVDPDHSVTSTLTTAIAAMPSLRPSRPSPSGLLALTLTRSIASPSTSASRLAISGSSGARRGA